MKCFLLRKLFHEKNIHYWENQLVERRKGRRAWMGADYPDDCRVGGFNVVRCGPGPQGGLRSGAFKSGLFLKMNFQRQIKAQSGSAALDFVLVSVPLLLLALGVVSISFSALTLGIIRDTAVEGARFAALADQTSGDGCSRARELLSVVLSPTLLTTVTCSPIQVNAIDYESVQISVAVPNLGLLAGTNLLQAESAAPREDQ